jgi:hypothetical protein
MSNVNDNNLDDLLRRAAEKYPLRTDSADWGKLVSDLERDPSMILPPVNGEDRRRRRRFFWLFLLLPLAGAGYYAWHAAGKSVSLAGQTNVAGQSGQKSVVAGKDGQAGVTAGKDGQAPTNAGVAGEKGQTNAQPKQGGHVGGVSAQAGEKGQQSGQKSGQTGVTAEEAGRVQAGRGGHVGGETAGQNGQASVAGQNGQTGVTAGKEGPGGETAEQTGQAGGLTSEHIISGNASRGNVRSGQDEEGLHLASNTMQRVNTKMRGNVSANNIPVKSNAQTKDNAKKDNIKLQKPKPSFYIGILGSPDLSTIKWQSVKNVGTRYGLLLGYSFNSRWSIESGAYYSKKNYYTDGEYFDKTNAYILKYVDQLKVDGVCNMWEFPVNVRYNLSTGEKMKWFATAGVSAYYMSKEKYDCSGYLNGAPWSEEWNKKPSHNSWSTNLNLSVGYEQRLGRIGNLRLEPYVRVPMSGIGTGKLSIMSAGLNIGITRRIW